MRQLLLLLLQTPVDYKISEENQRGFDLGHRILNSRYSTVVCPHGQVILLKVQCKFLTQEIFHGSGTIANIIYHKSTRYREVSVQHCASDSFDVYCIPLCTSRENFVDKHNELSFRLYIQGSHCRFQYIYVSCSRLLLQFRISRLSKLKIL